MESNTVSAVKVHDGRLLFNWRDDVSGFLPEAVRIDRGSKAPVCVVKHGIPETKILRNIGLDVPSPIFTQYDWAGTTPFDSQKITAALLSTEPRAYCLSSMGVGKTRAAMYAFDFMRSKGIAESMLVVAPLSTLVDVWEREVFEAFHHLSSIVLHGTKAQRLKALSSKADVYIINHDGVGTILPDLQKRGFDVVTIDELGAYRNSTTNRWKNLNALINGKKSITAWGLTGSPTPNEPTDAFGQAKLLTPGNVPRSMQAFRLQTMTQITQFIWVPKPGANDIVAAALKPSVRFTLDECHDIPNTTYSMRHVDPTADQKRLYKRMVDHFRMEHRGQQITAVNEGAKLTKLLQVSAGFAYIEGKGAYIDAKARIKEVVSLIEQADKKVLIFANYKWVIRALHEVISNYFTADIINGDVPKKERDKIFALFRNSKDPHVLIAHAGTMAHGLTLVEADTIIWYGPTMNSELYEQANARIRRPGQTSKTHVLCIESTPVEKRAFKKLQQRQKMQGLLLDLFEGVQDG